MVISSPIFILVNPASAMPLPTISASPSAPSTISQSGKDGDFTTQAALSSLTARPTNNIVCGRRRSRRRGDSIEDGQYHKIGSI
jgi:hypothetical protein